MQEDFFRKVNPLGLTDWRNNLEEENISVSVLSKNDFEDYKKIRLEAITTEPEAFNVDNNAIKRMRNATDDMWQKDLENKKQIVVLSRYLDRPIGISRAVEEKENIWCVYSVYLNKDFRKSATKSRIADKIFEKLLAEIQANGAQKVILIVKKSQLGAIGLYDASGFEKVDPVTDFAKAFELSKLTHNNVSMFVNFQLMELDLNKK